MPWSSPGGRGALAAFGAVADAIVGFEPDTPASPGTVRVGLGKPPTLAEIFVDALLSNAALALQAASPAEAMLLIQRAVAEIPGLPPGHRTGYGSRHPADPAGHRRPAWTGRQ
ncbi:MAG TPA: hypothetical protein VEF71_04960, partial [Streptosporangiaceae bacterium]|nr:hypothetical protein [Streptosporangiaceae bacterium]